MLRRSFLLSCSSLASVLVPGLALADSPASVDLKISVLSLSGSASLARRSLLVSPSSQHQPLPLLILLHGLGETGNEQLGTHAWGERYGLIRAYERLLHPPVTKSLPRQRFFTDEHLASTNLSLSSRPLTGLVVACPVTPNPWKLNGSTTIDLYASWLEQTLIPAVKANVPVLDGRQHTGIDGCSLGGYLSYEVFLRKPHLFGSVGGVQAAIGLASASAYAQRFADAIARVGSTAIHIETSTSDPYRAANEALSRQLLSRNLPNDLSLLPGPHNQPWLQEVGTLEMLLWHDRMLNRP